MTPADALIAAALVYALAGAAFAPWFLVRGAGRLDPAAAGSGWGFRLMILPGVVALWPWLAFRSLRPSAPAHAGRPGRDQRTLHALLWPVLGVGLVVAVLTLRPPPLP